MFISKLRLTNFRSHGNTEFDLAPLSIMRADNGGGKTSIAYALELLFTQMCDATDKAGRGAQSLIRMGAKELQVEAQLSSERLSGVLTYRRNPSNASLIIGQHANKSATAVLETMLAPVPILSAVMNMHRFLELTPNEQRDLLAKALATEPVPLMEHELLKGYATEVRSSAEVDALYDSFFKRRTDVNRDIKNLGDLTAPERPADMPSPDGVKQQMAEIQKERDAKVKKKAKLESDYTSRKNAFDAAQTQKAQYEKDFLSNDEIAILKTISENAREATKLDRDIQTAVNGITIGKQSIALDEKNLAAQEDHCPTCHQYIPNVGEIRQEMRTAIDQRKTTLEGIEASLVKLNEKRSTLGDPKDALAKIDTHARAGSACVKADEIINKGQPAAPDTSAIDTDIEDLEKRIANGQDVLQRVLDFEARARIHDEKLAKHKKLEFLSGQLEQMVEYFGPAGNLRSRLIGNKLPEFRDRINSVLEKFGFQCQLELEPYSLKVCVRGNNATA